MTEDELKELLDDIEAAGSNQAGSLEWGTGGFDRAARQARDLKAQALEAYREQRAEKAEAELNGAHESAQKYMSAWQAAEEKVERQAVEIVYLKSIYDDLLATRQQSLIDSIEREKTLQAQLVDIRQHMIDSDFDRNDMARQINDADAEIERQAAVLQQAREVIGAVEFDPTDNYCMWCGLNKLVGHAPDCPRQAALAALDAEQFDVEPLPKTQGEAFVQLWTDEDGKA